MSSAKSGGCMLLSAWKRIPAPGSRASHSRQRRCNLWSKPRGWHTRSGQLALRRLLFSARSRLRPPQAPASLGQPPVAWAAPAGHPGFVFDAKRDGREKCGSHTVSASKTPTHAPSGGGQASRSR
eukprot:scaffold107727_cov69-Phaeocystis_antarctica.AAC.1